jgi:hypothetical protein
MALTIAVGYLGNCALPTGHVAKLDRWSGSFGMALIDITGFDSSGFREALGGLRSGAGSATGHAKFDAASTTPGTIAASRSGGAATLTAATGCTITGTMLVSNVSHDVDVNGESRVTFDWAFTSTITVTWDETA